MVFMWLFWIGSRMWAHDTFSKRQKYREYHRLLSARSARSGCMLLETHFLTGNYLIETLRKRRYVDTGLQRCFTWRRLSLITVRLLDAFLCSHSTTRNLSFQEPQQPVVTRFSFYKRCWREVSWSVWCVWTWFALKQLSRMITMLLLSRSRPPPGCQWDLNLNCLSKWCDQQLQVVIISNMFSSGV